ncbi:MAG: LacI family DNA-binding transcriptional regulator [Spongiibacteraceae bacterium]|nr:LacI family DNA-binding transcriptional regulator [Spongiibacteraceae bacterium]
MKSTANQPTLTHVANAAGVSSATVSRFFNKPDAVAKKTAERIRQAVLETGYTPNMVAGSLASNKSQMVSILIPQLSPSLFIETIEEIVNKLSASGHVVTVGVTEFDVDRSNELIKAAIAYRAKAIIITAEISTVAKKFIRQSNMMAIEIWDLPADPIDVAVGFSHYDIGKKLAQFIKERGYIRPHFITNAGPRSLKRRKGFVDEWAQFGEQPSTESRLELPLKYEYSRSAFALIRRMDELPDVIVCGSDWLAQGIITEAKSFGMKIPDDIAVIGFGNSSISSEMRPTITSIDVDSENIAQTVTEILEKTNKSEELTNRSIDTGFKIIARESA